MSDNYLSLEEYVDNYNMAIYERYPKLINYINYINYFAYYFNWIGETLSEEDKLYNINYDYQNISTLELIDICKKIISQFGTDYLYKFNKCLNDGSIELYDADEDTFSYTTVTDNHLSIYVDRTYTLEDVFKLIHEFFHFIHVEKFSDNFEDENCYIYTELFALMGEVYAILFLSENDLYKNDSIQYLKRFFIQMYQHANCTLFQGFVIQVYDIFRSFEEDDLSLFFEVTNNPETLEYSFEYINDLDNFNYHEIANYILGIFPAILCAEKMINNKQYIKTVKYLLENINQITSIEDMFKYLNIDNLLNDEDSMIKVVDYLYEKFNNLFSQDIIIKQKKLGEL